MYKYESIIVSANVFGNNQIVTFSIYPGTTLVDFINQDPYKTAKEIKRIFDENTKDGILNDSGYDQIATEIQKIHPFLNRVYNNCSIPDTHSIILFPSILGFHYKCLIASAVACAYEMDTGRPNLEYAIKICDNISIFDEISRKEMIDLILDFDSDKLYFNSIVSAHRYAKFIINNVFLIPFKKGILTINNTIKYLIYKNRFDLLDYLFWDSGLILNTLSRDKFKKVSHDLVKETIEYPVKGLDKVLLKDPVKDPIRIQENAYGINNIMSNGQINSYNDIDDVYLKLNKVINKSMEEGAYLVTDFLSIVRVEFIEILNREIKINLCPGCHRYQLKTSTCPNCKYKVYTSKHREKIKEDRTKLEFYRMLSRNSQRLHRYSLEKDIALKKSNKKRCKNIKIKIAKCGKINLLIHALQFYVFQDSNLSNNFFYDRNETNMEFEYGNDKFEVTKSEDIESVERKLINYFNDKNNRKKIKEYLKRVTNDKEKNCIEKALNKAINSNKTENRK